MGTRKLRAKKYKSIYEYYRDSDPNKKTIAHYISYWVEDPSYSKGGTTKKERIDSTDPEDALKALNARKSEQAQKKHRRLEHKDDNQGSLLTIDQVATEYFKERKSIGNLNRDMKRYVQHIGNCLYDSTNNTKSKKGYQLTDDIKTYDVTIRGVGNVTRSYQREHKETSYNIGKTLIKDLDPNILKQLIDALENKGLKDKTIASTLNLLKAITNFAIAEGYITKNPFLNSKTKVKVAKEERIRLFTPQELQEIFKEAKRIDKRVFMLFKLLYYTGQRPKSIIALRVRDINLQQRKISIDPIKGQSGTYVPISDKLYPLLSLWIKGCSPDTRLFDIEYVTFQAKTQKIFEKYNKGLDYKKHRHQWASMYTFRHTSATVMLAKTDNIKLVQSVLNHSDPRVTAIYAKLVDESKQKGVNVL